MLIGYDAKTRESKTASYVMGTSQRLKQYEAIHW